MKIEWKTCLKIGVSVFLLYLCIHYWTFVSGALLAILGAAMPLFIGAVIAYLLNIVMGFYERHLLPNSKKKFIVKARRIIALILAIVTLVAVIALVIGLVLPEFIDCIELLINMIPGAIRTSITWIEDHNVLPDNIVDSLLKIDWNSKIGDIFNVVTSGIGSVVDVVIVAVTSVFSVIVTAILSIMFAIYLLLDKDRIGGQFERFTHHYFSSKVCGKIEYVTSILNDCFHRYIVGQCTEAVILGVLCTFGMMILQLPYATMIGALVAFTALIPIAGAYIGAGVGAFMILMQSPIKALIFLAFILILQQFEGNVIFPRVVGTSLGLPGIWVLAAVTVGGGILGIPGMLFGVPIAAAIYRIVRNDMNKDPVVKKKEKKETK